MDTIESVTNAWREECAPENAAFPRAKPREVNPDSAYEALVREMDEAASATGAPGLSMPKRIAALTLFVRATSGVNEDVALQTAMSALGHRMSLSRGGLKKASSEARAILQFGLGNEFRPPADKGRGPLLRTIAAALQEVKVREVTRARAIAYGGVRGGRRHGRRVQPALDAVRRLLELARAGDTAAQSELAAIEALIRSGQLTPSAEDRPEANP